MLINNNNQEFYYILNKFFILRGKKMSYRPPEEYPRSEIEEGLSGRADSGSDDCGCACYRLPKLLKYAKTKNLIIVLFIIGILQSAAQTYFNVATSTFAQRLKIDYYYMGMFLITLNY